MIFSERHVDGAVSVRFCTGSSLYVQPAFGSYAPLLVRRAERHKGITYLNIRPSCHTWPMVEAQGYKRFCNGQFVSIPILCKLQPDAHIQVHEATSNACHDARLQRYEADLLSAHTSYGCISVICALNGNLYPFVFGLRRKFHLPLAHLIYCRDQKDFILLAGPLGRFLGKRGFALVVLDAEGPIPNLFGKYLAIGPKYWKGPAPPRLGDLAYTELAMFGFYNQHRL